MGFRSLDPDRGIDRFTAKFIRQAAQRLVGKYGYTRTDRDDIEQELATELVVKFPRWDRAKGTRTTYAKVVLKRKIATMVRERRAAQGNAARCPTSLNVPVAGDDDGLGDLSRLIEEGSKGRHLSRSRRSDQSLSELRQDIKKVMSRMPVKLRNACRLLMHGLSITEAAQVLGISRVTATNRVRAILERFRANDLDTSL
jgi:RNA polymerase sigma-70 factor (ECF subfamily)